MQLSRRSMIRLKLMAASALVIPEGALFADIWRNSAKPATDQWFWLPGGPFMPHFGVTGDERSTASLLTCAEPNHGSLLHQHTREDEVFRVLGGSFEIEVADQSFHVKKGSSILAPKGVPHRWTNIGREPGYLLSSYTPTGLEQIFLSLAVPIASPAEVPAVDISVLGPRILHDILNAGITQAGPARFSHFA